MAYDFSAKGSAFDGNYTTEVKGGKLIITVDLSRDEYPLTKSQKSLKIASTGGFHQIEGTTLNLSMNLTAELPQG